MFRRRLNLDAATASRALCCALLSLCAATFAPTDAKAAELTFDLRVENGRLPENMRLVRVTQGDIVKLRWHVDRPMVLHLHGYDIEKRVQPDAVVEMSFTARATGRFPLHAHAGGAGGSDRAHEEAPLLYVEVYPR
ncbi:MAG TPA: hypothetical protein VLQ46_10815 [Casimicrobiaceae bacterium]|nr:hypothetical protein [Casimicrobiaceae bacterium]